MRSAKQQSQVTPAPFAPPSPAPKSGQTPFEENENPDKKLPF